MRVFLILYFVYGYTHGQMTGPANRFSNLGTAPGNGGSQLSGILPGQAIGLSGPGNGALPGKGTGKIPLVSGNGVLPGQGIGSSGPGFGNVVSSGALMSALGNAGPGSVNTPQGILNLNSQSASPSQLITSNCISIGNPCTPGAGPCCMSPVFSCQNGAIGNFCMVVPRLVPYIPQISQILNTNGISTPNPLL